MIYLYKFYLRSGKVLCNNNTYKTASYLKREKVLLVNSCCICFGGVVPLLKLDAFFQ